MTSDARWQTHPSVAHGARVPGISVPTLLEEMADNRLTRLAGTCAILAGASLPVSGVAYLLMPPAQQTWADPAAYLLSFAEVPTFAMIEYSANVLGAILALAVVVALPHVIRPVHEGWLRWATTVAILGYSVIALQYIRELALIPPMADSFLVADVVTRAATASDLYLVLLDPQGWITYGAVGAWLFAVNLLAVPEKRWPHGLSYVGIGGGVGYWLVVAGTVLQREVLVSVAAAAGVLLAAIWFIWIGLLLRRSNVEERPGLRAAATFRGRRPWTR